MTELYTFASEDVTAAFDGLASSLFQRKRRVDAQGNPAPRMLVVAGAEGSGKTYLLNNSLLASKRYDDYVNLYTPDFRKLHPQYEQMKEHGGRHAYAHTESFIWQLGTKIFGHALANQYDIIMETALDAPGFANVPALAREAGYQLELHLIACQKEFGHWATLERAVKSVAEDALERFVSLSKIETSQGNAMKIIDAFEAACLMVPGSQICLYQRGMETDRESRLLCHSLCTPDLRLEPQADYHGAPYFQPPHIEGVFEIRRGSAVQASSTFPQYFQLVHTGMVDKQVRDKMLKACCATLGRAQALSERIPADAFRELALYVLKYLHS
ncbi:MULTISPECIES: zeta toxin family protein [unclassified Pseudomonas]|uniref:zeta toxin family protein n=1 Tax=unclassified Pseudomonas TaxID=196821 RepID=UPI00244D3CD8|nr:MULTISPECIES: zeta toxin family protein [unclassified Pseudomonas]MDH0302327.1 zeta toxin family protein [Pseudomonas sp. GD04091]MDH1984769.1 zeta toxin family protein [Pseudomonas sp. GD03689]